MASKRFGGSSSDDYSKRFKSELDDLQEIRVLVENTEAGCIIGKGGSNVKKIRIETGGFISILKNDIPTAKERVMVLKGTVKANAHAIHLISQLLIDDGKSGTDQGRSDTCTITVLIHKFLAGCIIGKGGSIIKELKEKTGAHIRLSNDALPGSTEKTVTISGTADVIHAAAESIFTQLENNPLKARSTTILFVPGSSMYPGAVAGGYGTSPPASYGGRYQEMLPGGYGEPFGSSSGGYGPPHGGSRGYGPPHGGSRGYGAPHGGSPGYGAPHGGGYGAPHGGGYGAPHGGGYGGPPGGGYGGGSGYGGPSGYGGQMEDQFKKQKTEKIIIPTVCAGIVIGKGGSAISDIKAQSECHISIAAAEPSAPNDRIVSIKGTKHGINTAIYLIRQRVDAYEPRE